jgi:hypothetical protein
MTVTLKPEVYNARRADSRPAPGPFTRTDTVRMPSSRAFRAAFSPATCAANGVDFREPLKPLQPELDQATTAPLGSVIATMVLLKVAQICATPTGTFFFTFFFLTAPAFTSAKVPPSFHQLTCNIVVKFSRHTTKNLIISFQPFSYQQLVHDEDLCEYAHLFLCVVHELANLFDDASHGRFQDPCDA